MKISNCGFLCLLLYYRNDGQQIRQKKLTNEKVMLSKNHNITFEYQVLIEHDFFLKGLILYCVEHYFFGIEFLLHIKGNKT